MTYSLQEACDTDPAGFDRKASVGIFFVTHAQDKVTARILGLAPCGTCRICGAFLNPDGAGRSLLFRKVLACYALMFNLPLVPHYLSQTVLSSVDRIMIRDMVGKSEAGIYNLAYQISLLMTLFNTALSSDPESVDLSEDKGGKGKRGFRGLLFWR